MANSTTISGTAITPASASDTALCRVTGYLRSIHGGSLKGRTITVRHIHSPITSSSSTIILGEYQAVRSDSTGKVVFDAYKKSKVKIELPGRTLDMIREVNIPDAASAELVDIVFPYVASVAYDSDDETVSLASGNSKDFTITATLSDGETLDVTSYTTLASSDTSVATVSGVTITAVSAGTADITVSSVDTDSLSISLEPDGDLIARVSEPTITKPDAAVVTVT